MKKFVIIFTIILIFNCFNICYANNEGLKKTENISQESFSKGTNHEEDEIYRKNVEEAYKHYVLDRIDGPDIPDYIRQFANENDCFKIMKHYFWSYELFKGKGGVYSCNKNNKAQYIYDNGTKLRFAKWYEKRKFTKRIYGD